MNRPAAVTATIVLLVLGGLLCLAMTALMLIAFSFAGAVEAPAVPAGPGLMRIAALFVVAIFGLTALWQFATVAGLWRMKPWGRVSLLTFSGLMVTFHACGLLMLFFLPLPELEPGGRSDTLMMFRVVLFVFYAVPVAIGTWWLIYFTRPRVIALFSPDGVAPPESPRPASIVIIGWLLVTSAAVWPAAVYWQWPTVLLWMVLTGSSAVLVNTFWCGLTLYAGVGLLRWKMSGYRATLALYALGATNTLAFWLVPGGTERMQQLANGMRVPGMEQLAAQPVLPSPAVSVALGVLSIAIPLYFFLTRKTKFMAMAEAQSQGN